MGPHELCRPPGDPLGHGELLETGKKAGNLSTFRRPHSTGHLRGIDVARQWLVRVRTETGPLAMSTVCITDGRPLGRVGHEPAGIPAG